MIVRMLKIMIDMIITLKQIDEVYTSFQEVHTSLLGIRTHMHDRTAAIHNLLGKATELTQYMYKL